MEGFPWYADAAIGLIFGIFIGVIIGFCLMQKLNAAEKESNRK